MDLYMVTEEQLAWRTAVATGVHGSSKDLTTSGPMLPAHVLDAACMLYHEAPANHPVHAGTAKAVNNTLRSATLSAAAAGRHPDLLAHAAACLTTLRLGRAGLRHVDIAGLTLLHSLEAVNLAGNDLGLGLLTYRGEPVDASVVGLGDGELEQATAWGAGAGVGGAGGQAEGVAGVPGSAFLGLSALPSLRSLDISDNALTSLPGLLPTARLFPHLTVLSLAYNPGLGREGLAAIAAALPGLQQLDVSGTGLASLPLDLACLTSLRVLAAGDNRLGGREDVHVVGGDRGAVGWPASLLMLSRLQTLRELNLSHNAYCSLPEGMLAPIRERALLVIPGGGEGGQGTGVAGAAAHTTGFPALQYLDLSHNPLPAELDFTPLLRLPSLQELNVRGSPAADEASKVPGRVHTAAPERRLQFPGQQLVASLQQKADASFTETLQTTASLLDLHLPSLSAPGPRGEPLGQRFSTAGEGEGEQEGKEEADLSTTLTLLQTMALDRSLTGRSTTDWLAAAQGTGPGAGPGGGGGGGGGRRVRVILRGEYANDRMDSRARQRSASAGATRPKRGSSKERAGEEDTMPIPPPPPAPTPSTPAPAVEVDNAAQGGPGPGASARGGSPPKTSTTALSSRTGRSSVRSAPSFASATLAGQGVPSSSALDQAKLPSATKAPQRLSTAAELAQGRVRLSAMPVRISNASTKLLSAIPRASGAPGGRGAAKAQPAPLVAATAAVLPSYAAPLLEVDPALNRLAASALLVKERGASGSPTRTGGRRANPRAMRVDHLHEAYGVALYNPSQGQATGKYVFDGHAYVPQVGWGDGQQSALRRELDYLLAPGTGTGQGDAAGGVLSSQRKAYRAMLELGSEETVGPDGRPLPWAGGGGGAHAGAGGEADGRGDTGSAFARAKSRGRARSRSHGKTRWLEGLQQAEADGVQVGTVWDRARERLARSKSPTATATGTARHGEEEGEGLRTAQEMLGFDAEAERRKSQQSLAALQKLLATVSTTTGTTAAGTGSTTQLNPPPTPSSAGKGGQGQGAAALLAAMLQS